MLHDTALNASSRLLIDEYPLQVLPSLAVAIGLNEAIFVQQVHYWLKTSKHERNGRVWIYNTLEDWQKQFPFWSVSTVRRTIDALKSIGVLLTARFNNTGGDRTLWYAIDYDVLNGAPPCVDSGTSSAEIDKPSAQNGQMNVKPSAEIDTPSVQLDQFHLLKLNTSSAQVEQMLKEQRLTPETTQTPPPPRARGDVGLRGGGGGETMEDDVENEVEYDADDSLSSEADVENANRDLIDALAALGVRPEMASKAVLSGIVTSDYDVILCKRFIQSSTANVPAAVLWSQYLSVGRLPPAPYSEASTVTADQIAAARRMREESDRRAEVAGPVVGLAGLGVVLAGPVLRPIAPAAMDDDRTWPRLVYRANAQRGAQ